MTVAAGDRLGDWVVEKPLGEGGMGSVYRCHSVLAEDVHAAVKVLKRGEALESKERFVQELRTLSALNHPAIVRVLGGGRDDKRGIVYMAMELVDGKDLSDRLAAGPLKGDEAVKIFGPVADALAYAHQRGVAHRDIKPSNIMLRRDGTPVIVDFGIAVAEGHTRVTKEGLVPGTVVYLPPEVFEGRPPDAKSTDAYALGVVMWEAVTGRSPFAHDPSSGEAAVLAQVMGQKLRSDELDPGGAVPKHVREAIRRTTDPSPDTRLVDLGAVRDLLTTGVTAVPRKARRRSGCAIVAALLLTAFGGTALIVTVAAVGLGAWWLGSQGTTPTRAPVDLAATLEEAASALEKGDFSAARRSAGLAIDDHAEDPHANLMYGQALLADGDGLLARPYLCAAVDGGLGARVPGHTSGDLDCERGPGAATPLVDPLALARVDLSAAMSETAALTRARGDEADAIADVLGEPSGGGLPGASGIGSGGGGSGGGGSLGSGESARQDPPRPPARTTTSPPAAASPMAPPPPPAAAPTPAPSPRPAPSPTPGPTSARPMDSAPPPAAPMEAGPPAASSSEAPPADMADDAKAEKRDAEAEPEIGMSYDGRVVEGPLEWSQARTALSRIKSQFERCGEREPDAFGRVRLRIAISAAGTVTSVTVVDNGTGSSDLATCYVAAAQRATFPAADAPSVVEVDLSL